MSRYSRNYLRDIARQALQAKTNNDDRWLSLIMKMMLTTGLSANDIENRIINLAR